MRSILFVDDHPIYREGLVRSLEATLAGTALADTRLHTAATCAAAREQAGALPDLDLCLVDYRLPDGDGVTLMADIRRRAPLTAIGLLCAEPSGVLIQQVRERGGVAVLSKERDTDAIVAAIELLFDGGEVFDDAPRPTGASNVLSLRRREILLRASEGLVDKQIGDRLGITESAVRNHWQHIFARLDVANRTEAVTKAIRMGLI
jgi:DNA-binding NarL/FixJ family response regulator